MKTTLLTLLLILTFSSSNAEKQIELTPIVLPYDSLNIDEVYGYGATIIARSGNTIYHSTDDGASWNIALESETKLNQLYSKDPHTVFAIGDSGMVYRTMDYGTTWIDESVDTHLDLVTMAAKDAIDYLTLTNKEFGFYKKHIDSNYIRISNNSNTTIYSAVYQDSAYFFGGGYRHSIAYFMLGEYIYEYEMPCFVFDGYELNKYLVDGEESVAEILFKSRIKKRLKLFSSDLGIIHTAWHYEDNKSGINLNGSIFMNLNMFREGVVLSDGHLVYADVTDSIVNMITSEGYWITREVSKIDELYFVKEFKKLLPEMETINHVSKLNGNSYLFGATNSTIYKVFNREGYSQVDNKNVLLQNNKFSLIGNAKLLYITDYMGRRVDYKYKIDNAYRLPPGFHIVVYTIDGEVKSAKIMVDE